MMIQKTLALRNHGEENPVTHPDAVRKFKTSRVSELAESTYFQPLSRLLYICG